MFVTLLSTFLRNSAWNSKIPTKIAAAADKEIISKHDRVVVFSADIHTKKLCLSTIYKLCFCSKKECRKCIFWSSGDLNFKNIFFAVYPEDTSWRQQTKQIVKKNPNLWGKTAVDKSTWIKVCNTEVAVRRCCTRCS